MRRYTTFHDQAGSVFSYLSKDGQILFGSLPVLNWRQACDMFSPFEAPQGHGLVHMTLSMPAGTRLSNSTWADVARLVLSRSGLPSEMTPWTLWGGEDTRCDHVHIVSALQTFGGRPLEVSTSIRATDRLERDICQRLGLPEPQWRPNPNFVLAPIIPKRSQRYSGQAAWMVSDLNAVMTDARPTTLGDLNKVLENRGSPWRVELSPGSPGPAGSNQHLDWKGREPA